MEFVDRPDVRPGVVTAFVDAVLRFVVGRIGHVVHDAVVLCVFFGRGMATLIAVVYVARLGTPHGGAAVPGCRVCAMLRLHYSRLQSEHGLHVGVYCASSRAHSAVCNGASTGGNYSPWSWRRSH